MFITKVNPIYYSNKYSNPDFRVSGLASNTFKGSASNTLSWNTIKELKSLVKAYKEIKNKLNSLTEEGIKYIESNYPNVSIGESLIFHNCGEKNSSIVMRCAESFDYAGLTRIIERKGNSTWADRIVLNSFLIENEEKLLVNEDENKQKSFPRTREYLSRDEIEQKQLESTLQGITANLDSAILDFRKFLATIGNKYDKIPDGVVPYNVVSKFRDIQNYQNEIDIKLAKLPKKVDLALRKSYPNYKLVTGLTTHAFGDLGEEQISITYNPILAPEMENYRRLNVFDKNDNLLKTFVVSTSGKMVSNLNKNSTIHLPRKLTFVDANEIQQEEFAPSFQKYLLLYHDKLKGLLEHVDKFSTERLRAMNSAPLEFPNELQVGLSNVLESISSINGVIKKMPASKALDVKKLVPNLYVAAGAKGITFDGFLGDKKVYLLPINSKKHNNLIRLAIVDAGGDERFYVIKDLKYIVKNMNPLYPQVLPNVLNFLKEADGDIEPEIYEAISYLKEKLDSYDEILQTEFNSFIEEKAFAVKQKELRLQNKKRIIEENKKLKEARKYELNRIKIERIKEKQEFLEDQKEMSKLERNKLLEDMLIESSRRKRFVQECKNKLFTIKQNVTASSEEFKKQLEDLKKLTEDFLNTLN